MEAETKGLTIPLLAYTLCTADTTYQITSTLTNIKQDYKIVITYSIILPLLKDILKKGLYRIFTNPMPVFIK